MTRRFTVGLALSLLFPGCTGQREPATPRPEPSTEAVLIPPSRTPAAPAAGAQHLLQASVLAYDASSARWLPGQPIAVNRDYDFAFALSDLDEGPALALLRRITGNDAVVKRLARASVPSPEAVIRSALQACAAPCAAFTEPNVTVAALLFGTRDARLRTIVEMRGSSSSPRGAARVIHVSEPRPLEGPGSWTERDGAAIAAGFVRGVAASLTHHALVHSGKPLLYGEDSRCFVGAERYERGRVVQGTGSGEAFRSKVLVLDRAPDTFVLCGEPS